MEKTRKDRALFFRKKRRTKVRSKEYFSGVSGLFVTQGNLFFKKVPLFDSKEHAGVPFRADTWCWYNIVPLLTKDEYVSTARVDSWLLVLAAKDFPYYLHEDSPHPRIVLLGKDKAAALSEISEFEAEQTRPKVFAMPRSIWPLLLLLLLLFVWHGLRFRWFHVDTGSLFPALPGDWAPAFGLDMYRTATLGQWWRTVTALCLHNSVNHLLTNMVFGFVFILPLCRRTGYGLGIFLVVAAGAFGNACSALVQKPFVLSLGFSTAVFGAVGLLGALSCLDSLFVPSKKHPLLKKRILVYGAALLGVLAMLGGAEKEGTDSISHLMGLICGVILGVAAYRGTVRLQEYSASVRDGVQVVMGALAAAGIAYAWFLGLQLLHQA